MTQGTQVSDNRFLVPDAHAPHTGYLAGEYFARSWFGDDRSFPGDLSPHYYRNIVSHFYNGQFTYAPNAPSQGNVTVMSGYGSGVRSILDWTSNDTLKLYSKLGAKIRTHDFNASIFLAEADQSLALIGETATRLAKFLGALKSGNLYKASSFLAGGNKLSRRQTMYKAMKRHFKNREAFDDRKALANAVLEVQYGWRPLLSDAQAIGEGLASVFHREHKQTYTARRKIMKTEVDAWGNYKWRLRHVRSTQFKATVSQPPDVSSNLRLNNFAQVVSNRTPWLFVANWFLPFEDYLEARSSYSDLNIVRLIQTEKETQTASFSCPEGAEAWSKYFRFERSILPVSGTQSAASAIPLPNFKPFEKSLGWEHVLNGIALLNGTVKRYRD